MAIKIAGGVVRTDGTPLDRRAAVTRVIPKVPESAAAPPAYSGWNGVCWSPELRLICAVGNANTANNIMTSPDGVTWTLRSTPTLTQLVDVAWSPALRLFCAVGASGTNRLFTSPDGVTWTGSNALGANVPRAVTWSAELRKFCVVSDSSPLSWLSSDGVTWNSYSLSSGLTPNAVTWSPELSLFCAVGAVNSTSVGTSPDGITWTARTPADTNAGWSSVCWSPLARLFVAVSSSGTNRFMTSPDGVTWTLQFPSLGGGGRASVWAPEINSFIVVRDDAILTSPDGVNWYGQSWSTIPNGDQVAAVVWVPELKKIVALSVAASGSTIGTIAFTSNIQLGSVANGTTALSFNATRPSEATTAPRRFATVVIDGVTYYMPLF